MQSPLAAAGPVFTVPTRESPERVLIHSLTRMAELNGMTAEIVSTDGDTCVCRIATPGHECTNQLVKVCG